MKYLKYDSKIYKFELNNNFNKLESLHFYNLYENNKLDAYKKLNDYYIKQKNLDNLKLNFYSTLIDNPKNLKFNYSNNFKIKLDELFYNIKLFE
jgi:hypothetical protein|uniref:Uncharacterized protein n=1 Tax=viral metagenome TaxID=1070528 RepID=A0A6C0EF53_9ZZZZ